MRVADGSDISFMPETFAKAGEILKQLNDGPVPDLSPCDRVASLLDKVRTKEGFDALDPHLQAKMRSAAGVVNPRYVVNESMMLNFFSEAFGATRSPAKAEPVRRERIGEFLLKIAS